MYTTEGFCSLDDFSSVDEDAYCSDTNSSSSSEEDCVTDQDTDDELLKPDFVSPQMRDFVEADHRSELWANKIYDPPPELEHLKSKEEIKSAESFGE
jgi:hypothetical protein